MDKFIKILRIVLISFFLILALIWSSINASRKSDKSRNIIEKTMVGIYEAPNKVKAFIKGLEYLERSIKSSPELYEIGSIPDSIFPDKTVFSLHYQYEGNNKGNVLMQNITNGQITLNWNIDLESILKDCNEIRKNVEKLDPELSILFNNTFYLPQKTEEINLISPIFLEDSSIIFHCMMGYIYKIDKNSNLLWKSTKLSHHSLELDQEGNIWTCSITTQNTFANKNNFLDNAILCLSPEGEEKHFISLSNILKKNNIFSSFYANDQNSKPIIGNDPYHLNDVLPINDNGSHWLKGDVLLSIRNPNMIAQYRLSEDSIIWYKNGPWVKQHDVNIISDTSISVFNNNVPSSAFSHELSSANPKSNISIFNLNTGITTTLGENIFKSKTQGRHTRLYNDYYIIEETNTATYHILNKKGKLKCKYYIPFYSDKSNAHIASWARIYSKVGNKYIIQE